MGYDTGKRIKGGKRHIAVDAQDSPIVMMVHPADVQDRDGALEVVIQLLATTISKLYADGGCAGPKLRKEIREQGLPDILEIVEKPKDTKGFTVLPRRWVVERTFAWMGRCRLLSKDYEHHTDKALAWAQLAACRFLVRCVAREATARQYSQINIDYNSCS